jgi:hypothetical protein
VPDSGLERVSHFLLDSFRKRAYAPACRKNSAARATQALNPSNEM